jgi:hypothetical protein
MSGSLSWKGWWVVSEDQFDDGLNVRVAPNSDQTWDIVRELTWFGHPLMVEAANEIERLRAAGDALVDRLNDWHNGAPYDLDAEAIKAWEEARRG